MLNKKIKRSLSCVLLLSAALCFMSTPEKAEAIAFNGISWQDNDYYYYDKGKVYLWGYYTNESRGLTYEHKWNGAGGAYWADPRPKYEEDIFWNNQDVVGNREMGTLAEWGFETYWSEWDGSRINGNAETGGNTDVEYQRKATYWFRRFKNYPETKGVTAWGESYTSPDGNVHWQRPGQTMRVQVDNYQDFPGWRIQLDDYVKINYIQLVNNSGGIAKNYSNFSTGKNGVYEWLPEVTMTHNWTGQSEDKLWLYSQFDVTITGGENDYRIETYAASVNGKEVGYNSSGEYIKIDNSAPSGIWSSTVAANVWTNQNVVLKFQPTDARSGVNKWSYRTSTDNGATYSGYSAIINGGGAKDFSVTTEGKNKIISDISDNVNWYNAGVSSESYWIDKTAPTANAVASSTTWTNADVTLSVNSVSDALSGFDRITLPNNSTTTNTSASQVVSANASYTFAIRDVAGNVTNKTITVGNIDKVAPTANNVTASTTAWTNGNVTLTLTGAADALSGFSKIVLPDGTSTTSTSASYSASTNGTFTFKVYDNAGNVTNKSITVNNIDKVAPSVTNPGTIQNETTDSFDVIVSNVADAGSGIDRVQFPTWTTLNGQDDIQSSWTTNSAASGVGVGTTYTYKVNRSAHNGEFGDYNVHVYVYDKAGNVTSFAMPVHNKKDMTPPNVLTAGNDPAWTTSKTIVVSASDEHTGLTNITTPNGTTILNTGKGVVSSQSHVVNTNGNFVYSATDKYGNTTSRTVTVSSVDTQAPTGTEYGNPTAWTNTDFGLGLVDIVDTQSGYDYAKLPNGTTMTGPNPWQTITANGTYSFTLYDKVGNSKTYTEVVTKIDKAAPTGTITASPTNWTNGNVTLTLNANDTGGSGIYRIKDDAGNYTTGASDTFTVSANGTYDFTVYDNAGNSKVVSYTVSNIDKTSPGLTVTQNPSTWTKGEVTLTGAASDSQSGLVSIRETNTGIYAGRNLIPDSKPNQSSNLYGFAGRTLSQHLVAGQTYVLTINGRIDAQAKADGKELRAYVWNNGWTSATSVGISATTDTTTSIVYTPTVSGEHYFAAYLFTSGGSRLGNATLNWMKFESGSVFSGYTSAPEDSTTVAGNATFGVSQNGTFTYRATDAVGNVRDTSINVTNIDKTAPIGTTYGNPTAWTNTDFGLGLVDIEDNQSGYDYARLPNGTTMTGPNPWQTITANGTYSFTLYDKVGNTKTYTEVITKIDKVAPTANNATASTTSWTNDNVTLSLTGAADALSGFSHIVLPDGVTTVTTTNASYTATSNGTYTFRVYDRAGNVTNKSIVVSNIDKVVPTATSYGNPTAWTNTDFGIGLIDIVDVDSLYYRTKLPNGTYTTHWNPWQTITANGTYSFVVYDNAGNSKTYTEVVTKIDKTAPTGTVYGNPTAWTNTDFGIGLVDIVDSQSGYDYAKLPNGTTMTGSNPWQTITANGTYTFTLYDKVGNAKTYTEVVTKIDKVAPTGTITPSTTAWTNGNVTLTLDAADASGSGVYRIKDHSGAYTNGAVDTFVATVNGIYNFTVYDNVGNSKVLSYAVTNIDKTAPTANNPTASTTAWTNGTVTLSLTGAADTGGSGFSKIVLPNGTAVTTTTASQTVSVNGTYSFNVYDNAGNVTTKSITVSNIDQAAPTGVVTASPTAWTNGNVTLTLNAADTGGSGVYRIKDHTGNYTTGSVDTFVATANGTYNFTVYDNAGNSQVVSYAVTNIDKTAPTANNPTASTTAWTNGTVTLSLTGAADTGGSGFSKIVLPNGTAVTTTTASQTVSVNGTYSFNVYDNAGNVTTKSITVSNIDQAAPTGVVTASPTAWTNGNVTLTLNAADTGGSGVYRIKDHTGNYTTGSVDTFVATANGTYNFTVYDNAGNSQVISYAVTNIDKTAPTANNPTASTTAWTNGTVTLSLTGAADTGGSGFSKIVLPNGTAVTTTTASQTVSVNGTYSFDVYDNAGNVTTKSITVSNIDQAAPTGVITASPTAWTNGNVTLSLSASDLGVSGYYRTKLPNGAYTSATTFDYSVTGNGAQTFVIYDNAGNSTTVTHNVGNIDKTLPGGTIAPSTTAWTKGPITLTFSGTDAGGSNVDYVLDHASNKTIGASDSYVVSSNGTYQFTVFDKAGNSKVVSYAVSNIDLTAPGKPTIDLSTAAWTNGNVTFTIIPGTDNQSGVAYTQYQIDGGAWTNYTGVVTISTNGKHVINARTTDNVGWTGVTETKTASIDKVVPTADISVNTSWTNAASVAATLTASDADSGIATVTYQLSGATTKAATTVTSGDVISIVNEGQTTITLVATDAVGQTTTTTKVVKIDRTAPVFSAASISNATESGFDVTVTVTDGISGVNNVNLPIWRSGNYSGMKTFPHTGQGNGTHTYHVDMADIGAGADYVYIGKHVTDNAGNSAFAGDASFKLDVTAPTLSISQADTTVWTNKDVTVSSVSSDNFNGVETLTIAGNSTTKTTDVFAKPKILSVSLASRSTVSYLIAKGYDVTVDTTVTTLAQLSDYDIILSDGQVWSADKASLLNQAFAAGYRIYSTGNDTASGAIHPVTTSSAGSGSFTLTQYANTDHVELGDYDNIMKYYDGAMETDGGQLQVTAYPSDTRVLATNTLYGTASLLYSVNNNGGKWIHLQGFGPHGTMSRRILDELMLGTQATRQTYTEALTVASNGTYTVTAEDFFGNQTNQTITVSNIDKTLPGGTITSSNTAFTNGNVTLTFAGTDAGGSGVDYVLDNASNKTIGASDSYVVTSNGTYVFTIFDKAGNSKAVPYTVSNIDKSAPNATIASNVTGWTNQNVILTVSPADVGVSGYYRTLLPNGTYSTLANPTYTVTGNGAQTFVIYDNAGNNTTVTYNVGNIDKTLPGGTIAPSTTAWTNVDVTLTLNATDVGGSGVDRVMNPSGVVTSGTTASFTATTNGTFSFTVYDKAGNTKVVTYVVANIDKIKPVYTGNIAITNVTQDYFDVVITNVTDAQSGMNRVQFPTWTNADGQDDLGDWWSTTEYKGSVSTTTYTYRVQRSSHKDEFGLYNVHIYMFDNAGNYITAATSYVLRDQVFPLVDSITGNPTTWTNQNATLTVNGHDEHTGVKSITLPDGTVVATNSAKGANATADYTVSDNGSYTFKITDMYDNVTTQTVTVSKIDKVLPSATTQGNPVNWTNQNQTLTITGSDVGGSGFKQIKLPSGVIVSGSSATYTVSQNGSYSFVVYDNAGNSRTISEQVTKIDKETPGGGITGNPVNWTNQNATLTLNAADTGGAGVKGVYLPNGTFVTTTSTASYVATQNGTYTFKTVDFAGNETSVSATVTKIDKVAPTVASVGGNPMQWTNVSQVLRVTGADGLSGMASIKRPDNSVVTGAVADYTVHQNGGYVFTLTDAAGNSTTYTVDVTKIDKGNPSQSSVNISVTNSQQ